MPAQFVQDDIDRRRIFAQPGPAPVGYGPLTLDEIRLMRYPDEDATRPCVPLPAGTHPLDDYYTFYGYPPQILDWPEPDQPDRYIRAEHGGNRSAGGTIGAVAGVAGMRSGRRGGGPMDDSEPETGFRYLTMRPAQPGDPAALGGYRIRGRIGAGGQGTVFLARDGAGRAVALKTLRPDRSDGVRADPTADLQQPFDLLLEVQALSALPGTCTARLLDVDLTGSVPYLVTEVLDGPSLAGRVGEDGPVRGPDLDLLAVETLQALDQVHRRGWVHRDVKPGNILLGPQGPRIIDFDIAVPVGTVVPGADSRDGVYATPPFMAPEVLLGGPAGAGSDIFSWACTIAFAATGRSPFQADDAAEVLRRVEEREPSLVGVPGTLRPLLYRCLAKEPQDRPTADWLLARLSGTSGPPAAAAQRGPAEATPAWGSPPTPTVRPASGPRWGAPTRVRTPRPATAPPGPRLPLVGTAALLFVVMVAAALATGVVVVVLSAARGEESGTLPSGVKAAVFVGVALALLVPVMRRIGIVTGRIGTSRGQVRRATAREAVVLCLQAFGLAFAAGVVVVAIAQGTLAQRAPELPDNVTRVVVMGLASVILALLLRRRQP